MVQGMHGRLSIIQNEVSRRNKIYIFPSFGSWSHKLFVKSAPTVIVTRGHFYYYRLISFSPWISNDFIIKCRTKLHIHLQSNSIPHFTGHAEIICDISHWLGAFRKWSLDMWLFIHGGSKSFHVNTRGPAAYVTAQLNKIQVKYIFWLKIKYN